MNVTLDSIKEFAQENLLPLGLRLLVAVGVFLFGRAIVRMILRTLDRVMERSKLDISLRKFLGDVAYAVLIVAVVIVALDTLGIKTTAVVAVLGAMGLAIGLALQGSLSNFAAGVMLIVLRPYKVTDLVVIGKYLGRVEAIKVFHTVLITGDNREITIPNGQIIGGPIENLTVLGKRRIDLVVTVNQLADIHQVKTLLENAVRNDERVHAEPSPAVDIAEVADASVKLFVRPWATCEDYPKVVSATMERIKDALLGAGLKFAVTLQPAP
jgi:small conductance mechanosensitive channel